MTKKDRFLPGQRVRFFLQLGKETKESKESEETGAIAKYASSDSSVSSESTVSCSMRPGVMLLLTILITGSTALMIGMHLALRGIDELERGFSGIQAQEVLAIADGCLEGALFRLAQDVGYRGEERALGDGSCTVRVAGTGGERRVEVYASIDRWVRVIRVRLELSGTRLTLLHWSETSS